MAEKAKRTGEEETVNTRGGSNSNSPATSPSLGSVPRPSITRSPVSNPNFTTLPPLVTTNVNRRTSAHRIPSYASKRLSVLSNNSGPDRGSRPGSTVFPIFHSSLPYALVRDFAYDSTHILHYGPPPDPGSAASTNPSEFPRRLSDPLVLPHQGSRTPWSGHPGNFEASLYGAGPQLPATSFADGPPWREDEDLLSPIVSTRHRKVKSDVDYFSTREKAAGMDDRRASYAGMNRDGSHNYYVDHAHEVAPDGPGGEIITLPHENTQRPPGYVVPTYSQTLHNGEFLEPETLYEDDDESRFSRDYSFSIASPDEEMHGKAIALFDFKSENENELALREGQVLWVSYRHGQGWLVAKDPATGEDGLVPEAYVRLEREIQGGFSGLKGQAMAEAMSPVGPETPTAATGGFERSANEHGQNGNVSQYPMVSRFTTSSKDLLPHDKPSHTPISPQFPDKQPETLEAVAHRDERHRQTSASSDSDDPETDEDDTQPVPKVITTHV